MADPLTLAGVGVWALSEGVKFLFQEAGEALKLWRAGKAARDAAAAKAAAAAPPAPSLATKPPAAAFEGTLAVAKPNPEVVAQVEEPLKKARAEVLDLCENPDQLDPKNPDQLASIDRLRRLMEAVLEHRITFKGEDRPPSGPLARGEVNVKELLGEAAGISVDDLKAGTVEGKATADTVHKDAKLYGTKIKNMG